MFAYIDYLNFQDSTNISGNFDNLSDSVFLKDISFKHENEFRIIARENVTEIPPINYQPNISRDHTKRYYDSKYNKAGTKIKLENFNDYNFEIVHHPKSTDWTKDNINKIIKKFEVNFNVFDSNLELK
ncbi:hypothetical protein [Nonlabens sp. Asnod3-A02]|uniref:hypothetical protein n=1 Tax=Nonlabens sp. Asnod3-A02 TaxID=3160579 RepID=UPI0038654D3D